MSQVFNLPVVTSETGIEFVEDERTLLVFSCFESEAFDNALQLNLKA